MNRDFKGVWIPRDVWINKDLSITEKCLLIEIDSLDNEKGCFASNTYFAEFFNISQATITRMVKKLQDMEYIETTMETYERGTRRVIKVTHSLSAKCTEASNQNAERGSSQNDEHNNTVDNNTFNNNSLRQTELEIYPTFEHFWDRYDKKTGKPKCEKVWNKISQKDREEIMEHLKIYVPNTPDKKYRKNPYTYLNQKAWKDEIVSGSTTEQKEQFYDANREEARRLGIID